MFDGGISQGVRCRYTAISSPRTARTFSDESGDIPGLSHQPKFIDQQHPVVTAPFRFVQWTPNETIALEADADYWDGAPRIQKLIFKVVPDSATQLIQPQTGQIQVMDGIDPNDLPMVERDRSLKLITVEGLNVCYLSFNCEKPPLNDKNLRRLIVNAIDKRDLVNAVYRSAATVAKNPLLLFVPSYNATQFPSLHRFSTPSPDPPACSLWRL